MKKRGFTLIELLAVIVILAIILAIAIPSITSVLSNAKKNAFEDNAKMLIRAINNEKAYNEAFDYTTITEDNVTDVLNIPNDNYKTITVETVDNKPSVTVVGQNKWEGLVAKGTYNNITVLDAGNDTNDTTPPTVTFGTNGNSSYTRMVSTIVTIEDSGTIDNNTLKYLWSTSTTEPVESDFLTAFSSGDTVTSQADMTGQYYLWILAKDITGNTAIVKSNVFNLDNTVPVITMLGSNPTTIAQGSTYTDAGATATDNIDGTITTNIVPTSNVNTNIAGTYTVTYNVSDSAGNTATATRSISVLAIYNYQYTGNYQTVTLASGTYTFELWGAKGGDFVSGAYNYPGGKGGYSKGTITINTDTSLYLYVGGAGKGGSYTQYQGGWNGGGTAASGDVVSYSGGGGGATDIRLVSGAWNNAASLASRIMVAGGGSGGGGSYYSRYLNVGVNGGGVTGESGTGTDCCGTYHGVGGTQSTGNALGVGCSTSYFGRSGAGGGYYGGMCLTQAYGSSGGGSGFVPGHPGVAAQSNGYTFTNTVMTSGINAGDGKIVITKVQ